MKKGILMCYGKTPYTPGRYLEDGFRQWSLPVQTFDRVIDFSKVDLSQYSAVVFVESPSRKPVQVKNIKAVNIPIFFWIHHGAHRWRVNMELVKQYQPDILLMAHSLYLGQKAPVPTRFFPFAMDPRIFNCTKPILNRSIDIGFVGAMDQNIHIHRNQSLEWIKEYFGQDYQLNFAAKVYLEDLAELYGNSKIVFNQSADVHQAINMRLFEAIGCGALVISEMVPDQERILIDGNHYVVYQDRNDLRDKLNYYLKNPEKTQEIATAGRRHLLSKHTYKQRAREVLLMINELKAAKK